MKYQDPIKYRKAKRKKYDGMSEVIDKHYEGFFEVARFGFDNDIKGTRIETPYGDFTIIFKPDFS